MPAHLAKSRFLIAAELIIGLAVSAGPILLWGWFASEVGEGETLPFDMAVREWVHQFASPGMTSVMVTLSVIGSTISLFILFLVASSVFAYLRRWREIVLFAVTMAGEMVLDQTLKLFYARARPVPLVDYPLPASYSFPSGHSLGSLCLFAAAAWLLTSGSKNRAARPIAMTLAMVLSLAIGLSRIYLGVHYPTDVIAGFLAAAIWLGAVFMTNRYLRRARLARRPA